MNLIRNWGFTAEAELLNGRLAMIGFVLAIATELITGHSVAYQLGSLIPKFWNLRRNW